DGAAARVGAVETAGPSVAEAPVAATTVLGSGGSVRSPALAAPASIIGTAAGVPATRLCSSGLVSRASRVGSPSTLTATRPFRPVGTTAFQSKATKLLTGTVTWLGSVFR